MLTVTNNNTFLNSANKFIAITVDEVEGFDLIVPEKVLSYHGDRDNLINNLLNDDFIKGQFNTYKDTYFKELCEEKHLFVSYKPKEEQTTNDYLRAILEHFIPQPVNRYTALWTAFNFDMVTGIAYNDMYYELVYNSLTDENIKETFKFKSGNDEIEFTLDDIVDLGLSVYLK